MTGAAVTYLLPGGALTHDILWTVLALAFVLVGGPAIFSAERAQEDLMREARDRGGLRGGLTDFFVDSPGWVTGQRISAALLVVGGIVILVLQGREHGPALIQQLRDFIG